MNSKIVDFPSSKTTNYDAAQERYQNVLGKRISTARSHKKMSLSALQRVLSGCGVNVTPSSINKWETGKTAPDAYQLLALCFALGIKDVLWEMTGLYAPRLNAEGLKKLSIYENDLVSSGLYDPALDDLVDMPVSYLGVSAGLGEFLDGGSYEMLSFPRTSIPTGAKFGLRVSGDSMEPVYHDQQIVWVHPCDTLNIGDVGIFIYDDCGYIKVYNEQPPAHGLCDDYPDSTYFHRNQPVLVSYNCKYTPIPVDPNRQFRVVGRVVG